tara:strand:+ start:1561 stop:2175 length:615 start_codon:yes stop_codon:yes gene_type:complete
MAFDLTKTSNGASNSDWPKGVYIDKVKITKAENKDSTWNDCNLFIEAIDTSGKSKYPKKFFIGGKHKKDGNKFVDWGTTSNGVTGGSWKVRDFFIEAGVEVTGNVILEDGSISEEILADLLDREVFVLQYDSNGKYSRETWFYFESGNSETGVKDLLNRWNGFDDKPSKYLHVNKSNVQNKKLNNMWDNLPANNTSKSELDNIF